MNVDGLLVLWGGIDRKITDEDALNDWWTGEHLPERLRLPGFQRARRYRALGSAEYLAWYEVTHVRDLKSKEYLEALNDPTPRTRRFMPCLAAMNRSACQLSWTKPMSPEPGDTEESASLYLVLAVIQTLPAKESGYDHVKLLSERFHKGSFTMSGMERCSIAKEDLIITSICSSSASYDGVHFDRARSSCGDQATGRIILLLELSLPEPPTLSIKERWAKSITGTVNGAFTHVEDINTYELILLDE
ncbi:hypothetical protein CC86DRAFT_74888 [Ophiobolus disseminans]|uniref:Uncharacterized protein n=1 Tax=Ophiobolus disseminans TaxID=1469910 RepID=A0A6A6ZRD1_9PLEO|nr:hypothetical protein CC86DRAFT_74888 [Ophiobolus disseminans]